MEENCYCLFFLFTMKKIVAAFYFCSINTQLQRTRMIMSDDDSIDLTCFFQTRIKLYIFYDHRTTSQISSLKHVIKHSLNRKDLGVLCMFVARWVVTERGRSAYVFLKFVKLGFFLWRHFWVISIFKIIMKRRRGIFASSSRRAAWRAFSHVTV